MIGKEKIIILQDHVQSLEDRFNSSRENSVILERDLSWESIFSREDPEKDPLIKELAGDIFEILAFNQDEYKKEISKSIQNSPLYRQAKNDSYKTKRGSIFEKDIVGEHLKWWINEKGGVFRERIKGREEMESFKQILSDKKIPGLAPQVETGWMGSAADWMIILPSGREIPICCCTKLWGGGGQGDRANLYSNLKKTYPDNSFLVMVCEPPPKKPKNTKSTHDKLESLYILNEEVIWISELKIKLNLFLVKDLKNNIILSKQNSISYL